MKTRVSSKGQVVLPAELRRRDGIEAGQEFEIESLGQGDYKLKRIARRNRGLVKHLLACPAKDWFKPLGRTETTDGIEPLGLG